VSVGPRKVRRLYWDIETSPNVGTFWSAGFKRTIQPDAILVERSIICICWKWRGEKKVHSLHWDRGDDRAMLEQFMPVLESSDEAVAHFGNRFDRPWVNGRLLLNGLPPMRPDLKTVDTCAIARSRFMLNSNKLDYLATKLLGAGKSKTNWGMWKTLAGVKVFDLLPEPERSDLAAAYVSTTSYKRTLRDMVDYCKRDVVLLEQVADIVVPFHASASHAGVMMGRPKWTCSGCGSESVQITKDRTTSKGTVQWGMLCNDCRHQYTISDRAKLDRDEELNRRQSLLIDSLGDDAPDAATGIVVRTANPSKRTLRRWRAKERELAAEAKKD